jgi:hypothetical protein
VDIGGGSCDDYGTATAYAVTIFLLDEADSGGWSILVGFSAGVGSGFK